MVMPARVPTTSGSRQKPAPGRTARTIRFPDELRDRIASDAGRCGRSFESHVIAILRRHFGEDVDISPSPDAILSHALGSLAGVTESDRKALLRPLMEPEPR